MVGRHARDEGARPVGVCEWVEALESASRSPHRPWLCLPSARSRAPREPTPSCSTGPETPRPPLRTSPSRRRTRGRTRYTSSSRRRKGPGAGPTTRGTSAHSWGPDVYPATFHRGPDGREDGIGLRQIRPLETPFRRTVDHAPWRNRGRPSLTRPSHLPSAPGPTPSPVGSAPLGRRRWERGAWGWDAGHTSRKRRTAPSRPPTGPGVSGVVDNTRSERPSVWNALHTPPPLTVSKL